MSMKRLGTRDCHQRAVRSVPPGSLYRLSFLLRVRKAVCFSGICGWTLRVTVVQALLRGPLLQESRVGSLGPLDFWGGC